MLQNSILIALIVNGLFLVPIYSHYVLRPSRVTNDGTRLKNALYRKPFNCAFCMAFWTCIIIQLITLATGGKFFDPQAPSAIAAAFLAALFQRLFHSLPTSI